ncbi:MAG: hypothetical protein KKC19_02245 [Nanoarchaeota archaeon]|nr:hypothetical protein [Nanoarchaeota archaeon]
MKKSRPFLIILAVVSIIIVISIFIHLNYFENIRNNVRTVSKLEGNETIRILNQNLNLSGYEIDFESIYTGGNQSIVRVSLTQGNSREHYLVDLKSEKVRKRS